MRARIDSVEPEILTTLESSSIQVGPGYVLARHEGVSPGNGLKADHTFVMYDEASGCNRPLPGMGGAMSWTSAADARHVYWYSYETDNLGNLAGPVSFELVRVDVKTGARERIITPGLAADAGAAIAGQDEQNVYVTTAEGLFAVRKP